MRHLFIFLLILTSYSCFGQRIYQTQNKSEADFIIYYTDNINEADWVVKKTEWDGDAKNGKWKFTTWRSSADMVVYITKNKNEADKIVCFTDWDSNIKFKK